MFKLIGVTMVHIFLRSIVMVLLAAQGTLLLGMFNGVNGEDKSIIKSLDVQTKATINYEARKKFLEVLPSRDTQYNGLFDNTVTPETIQTLADRLDEMGNLLDSLPDAEAEKLIDHKINYIGARLHKQKRDAWKNLARRCRIPLGQLPSFECIQNENKKMLRNGNFNASWNAELPEIWTNGFKKLCKEKKIKETNFELGIDEGNGFYAQTLGASLDGSSPIINLNKKYAKNPITPRQKMEMEGAVDHEGEHVVEADTLCEEVLTKEFINGNYWNKFGTTIDDALDALRETQEYENWVHAMELWADVGPGLNNKEFAVHQIVTFQNHFDRKGSRYLYAGSIEYLMAIFRLLEHKQLLSQKKELSRFIFLEETDTKTL